MYIHVTLRMVAGRSTDCCWGPSRLVLEETNDFWSGHPLEAILVPAPLYHRPHAICDLSMNRSQRSVVIEHRVDYRRLNPSSKRGLPGEDLGPTREDDYFEIIRPEGSAHLPSKHAEREHVSGLGGACGD